MKCRMFSKNILSLLIAFFCFNLVVYGTEADLDCLHNNINEISVCGYPGSIAIFCPDAFAVIEGRSGNAKAALVAAADYGKGRIVVFAHDGYLGAEILAKADTGKFMKNCISWAGQKSNVNIGIFRNKELTKYLENDFKANDIELDKLDTIDVLIINSYEIKSGDLEKLEKYLSAGGGLITAGTGWGWKQLHPGKKLATDLPANKLLAKTGLIIADGYAETTTANGYLITRPSTLLNASVALDASLESLEKDKNQTDQICFSIVSAIQNLPDDDKLFLPKLNSIKAKRYPKLNNPVGLSDLQDRIAISLEMINIKNTLPGNVKAHPAAAIFPGLVPTDAPHVTETVEIDMAVPRWHSTGLYAAPGEQITILAAENVLNHKLKVRIGCHTDSIWNNDKWCRMPEITSSFPINNVQTTAANAFGGLIYIDVTEKGYTGKTTVTISGAIKAPYFVLGQTSIEQWKQIRQFPGPWGELATDKIIITVPSANLRLLDDPAELMKTWDKVLDACAELAAINKKRPSPERIVPDIQISLGYMHSGYPIMTHSDQYDKLVSVDNLLAGSWGLYHELGHNHQNGDWTFNGSVEVTVNLFTLYVYDKVCRISTSECDRSSKEFIASNYADYEKHGKDFNYWKSQPFLALSMYMQLQHKFGWEPFRQVFAEYLSLPQDQRPQNDNQKRNQWMVRFSRQTGYNLGPFFEMWNVPVSNQAKASIKDLPIWIP